MHVYKMKSIVMEQCSRVTNIRKFISHLKENINEPLIIFHKA